MDSATLEAEDAIDLQLHTIHSDGEWTPEALIDHLIAEGFAAAAITDHDRVDITAELQALAAARGFRLLVAVELSTQWRGEPVDVLCYGFDPDTAALHAATETLLRQQQANIRQTVEQFRAQGCVLPEDAVEAILSKPVVQQPHALVDLARQHGYGTPDRSPGRLLVDAGLQQITFEIGEAVAAGHQSGGVCLIAHPGRGDGYVCFDEALLDQLRAEVPIDGLEADYPRHSPEQIAMYRRYAEQHGLLISAGSDSHTPEKPPVHYPAAHCRRLLNRLGLQVRESKKAP